MSAPPSPRSSRHSSSSSETSEDELDMSRIVTLASLNTLGQLYKSAVIKVAKTPRYPAKASYLDRVSLWQGDITKLEVDSIVNAANRRLLGGGGVDGAIHAAAGPKLLEECRGLNGAETGESKITKGYRLPSKHIIHTVGPVYSSSDIELKAKQLASCYRTSLELAVANSLKHIAFPSISTGIYGYPIEDATHIALDEVRQFYDSERGNALDRVVFVVWSNKDKNAYESLIPEYFPSVAEEAPSEVNREPVTEEAATNESDTKATVQDEPVKQGV